MNLADSFLEKKQAVAKVLLDLGADTVLPGILDTELGEQSKFDHREIPPAEVVSAWVSTPSISELTKQATEAGDITSLCASSYAFRLVVMSNVLRSLKCTNNPLYSEYLGKLGIGSLEVENYAADFVK